MVNWIFSHTHKQNKYTYICKCIMYKTYLFFNHSSMFKKMDSMERYLCLHYMHWMLVCGWFTYFSCFVMCFQIFPNMQIKIRLGGSGESENTARERFLFLDFFFSCLFCFHLCRANSFEHDILVNRVVRNVGVEFQSAGGHSSYWRSRLCENSTWIGAI